MTLLQETRNEVYRM